MRTTTRSLRIGDGCAVRSSRCWPRRRCSSRGATGSSVFTALAAAPGNAPFLGGVALVDLAQVVVIATDAVTDGTGIFSAPIPPGPGLVGKSVYLQSASLDAAQPAGFRLSNGLALTVCP